MNTRIKRWLAFLACFPLLAGCSPGSGGNGGTETGTTDPINTSSLAAHLEVVADTLVPEVSESGGSSLGVQALTLGTSDQWDQYLEENNLTVLTDVFGPGDEDGVVTRIRVLVNHFRETIEGLFSQDPEISCDGSDPLGGGDEVEVAFLGSVSNGTSEDRYFDCVFVDPQDDPQDQYTTLYGRDADNTIRIVHMYDVTNPNELWLPEERGNFIRNLQVVYATYAESAEEDGTVGYLDLQYAQASIYSGLDDDLEAEDDNVLFKSRTRITGRATLDESGMPTSGVGDFAVTKYDRGVNEGDTIWEFVTKTVGRGDYSIGGYSLFRIDSDASSLVGAAGTFCIRMPEEDTGLPDDAEGANCSAYETAYAWGDASFPFDPEPAIDLNFEDKDFFEETDLIENSGENFTIPSY